MSCFGPPLKNMKLVKKPSKKSAKVKSTRPKIPISAPYNLPFAMDMDSYPGTSTYMSQDGMWQPTNYTNYWWPPIPNNNVSYQQDRAKAQQEAFDNTINRVKTTHENVAELQAAVGDLKATHSEHVKKSDSCLAEVQKVYKYLETVTKRKEEKARRAAAAQAEAARKEEEAAKLQALQEIWGAEKQEMLRIQQQQKDDYADQIRLLREEVRSDRRESSKHRHNVPRLAEEQEEAFEREKRRERRRQEEEERARYAKLRRQEEEDEEEAERFERRAEQQRHHGASGRQTYTASPDWEHCPYPSRTSSPRITPRHRRPARFTSYS